MNIQSIKKSEFFQNIFKMFSSTVFAQLIQIIGNLLLARLYDPTQFGIFSLFMSILMFLVILATLRYESIIIIEKIEKIVIMIMQSLFAYVFSFSLLIMVIVVFLPEHILIYFKINSFYYLIPMGVLVYAFYNILTSYFIRTKNFSLIAKSKIFIALFIVIIQTILFYLNIQSGLIWGFILGYFLIVLYMYNILDEKIYIHSKKRVFTILKKYFYLVKFGLPAQLVDTMSNAVLPILIALWFDLRIAGIYFFAYKITNMPLQLIGVSIGKVFYQKASYLFNHKRDQLYPFVMKIIIFTSLIVSIPLIVLFFFSEDLIVYLIGDRWAEAGAYISVLVFMLFFRTIFSSMNTLADITQKLHIIFVYSILIFIVYVVAMYIGHYQNDFILSLKIITVFVSIIYIIQTIYLIEVVKKLHRDDIKGNL